MGKKRPATRRPPVLASNPRARASAANPSSVDARIDPRQLSPSRGDYGMDDRDIDAKHDVLEDDPPAANVGDGVTAGDNKPIPPSTGGLRAPCWKHMTKKKVTEDGVVHYFAVCNYCKRELSAGSGSNRHYKACLARLGQTQGGGMQTQLNFAADGTVARNEIANFIVSKDLPIMLGENQNFKKLIQRAFCPQNQPILSITLDNASAKTTAIEILTLQLQSYIKGYIIHHSSRIISVPIRFITCTPQMIAKFAEYCRAHDKRPRKFALDMKVRWNSTYHMLKSLETTNVLSGAYYPTTCLVIDYIWLMAESFSKYRSDSLLRTIVDPMKVKFLKYFEQISHVYCFATIFDPRKKLDGLQTALEGIGDALDMDFSDAFNHIKEELFNVFGYYYEKYGESEIDSHVVEPDADITDTSLTTHLWKRVKEKEPANSSSSQRWNPNTELNHYLSTNFAGSDRALRGEKIKLHRRLGSFC
ncbi:hypothetical protein U9M48_025385 [Paspalum notatum var. saurae]|uniref:hAT-like transposase RNase-H fold domain-containing protein n=1 Tax=Paspalum notatum var. saurae TaxID=547442 RepID=A0AAQ3TT54_PASNO